MAAKTPIAKTPMVKAKESSARFKAAVREHYEQARKLKHSFGNKIMLLFITLFLFVEGILLLHRNGVISLPDAAVSGWPIVILIVITFLIASVFVRITNALLFKTFKEDVEVEKRLFLSKLYSFIIYIIAIIISLNAIGVTGQNITIFAGFLATGFALSMREVILSYIVWMVLLFKHPFRIGDIIKVGEDEGLVEHIGTFYVRLSDGSGDPERSVRLPTKMFLEKAVQNYGTAEFLERFYVAVPEGADVDKLLTALRKAVHDETDKNSTLKNVTSVNLDTAPDGKLRVVVVYPVILENRSAVRTRVLLNIPKK